MLMYVKRLLQMQLTRCSIGGAVVGKQQNSDQDDVVLYAGSTASKDEAVLSVKFLL